MKNKKISSGELKAKLEAGDALEIVDIRETAPTAAPQADGMGSTHAGASRP